MQLKDHVYLMADYNQWMNQKVYEAVGTLSPELLHADKKAFWGSIFATLNHLCVTDTQWLKRFEPVLCVHQAFEPINTLDMPKSLDEFIANNFIDLKNRRQLLDETLLAVSDLLTDEELMQPIHFESSQGKMVTKTLFNLLMHVFNHQTHHRGQLTTLLSQSGVNVGITDLVFIQPNVSR